MIYVAVLGQKINKSTDFGTTWSKLESSVVDPWGLSVCYEDPTFISYARYLQTGYFSTNSGMSFSSVNFGGIGSVTANSILNPQRGLLLLHCNKSLQKLIINYNVTIDVRNITTVIPDKFSLSQNYPNPFNPNTNIKFELPKSSFVTLKVFDAVGREVSNLVNEDLSAGEYEVNFNGSDINSGIYFYKLETDNYIETRKMILIK